MESACGPQEEPFNLVVDWLGSGISRSEFDRSPFRNVLDGGILSCGQECMIPVDLSTEGGRHPNRYTAFTFEKGGGAPMLGTRLRQARLAAGLSLEGLAAKLEHPISKQALSKYEKGSAQPNPIRISDIAQALNVTASSLLTEDAIEIKWEAFRKHAKLSKARQNQLTAIAQQKLEGEFRLRGLFHLGDWHDLPGPIEVQNFNDCEYAAAALRMHWSLGDRPIDGLLELIEERGGSVIGWHEEWGFDALSGWADRSPILVLNTAVPPDRQRFNAAHELGHLIMEDTGDSKVDEQFAHRFAAAFLVPAEAARRELGTHRRGLDLDELGLLKRRWGLSMQAWIRRARDLDIIGEDLYRSLNIQFRTEGWHRTEPHAYQSSERPALFRRLVLRAFAENMITTEDAESFLPGISHQRSTGRERRASLRELARRSLEERHRMLQGTTVVIDPVETATWDELPGDETE